MGHWAITALSAALAVSAGPALAGPGLNPGGSEGDSTPAQRQLAKQLNKAGLKYYGSWRCPACQYQGRLFGTPAVESLPYVECARPQSLPAQHQACLDARIMGFPTWIHPSGERRVGVQSLDELRDWVATP